VKRLVVLISGRGSNLEAILSAVIHGQIAGRVAAVISNRAEAAGLALAQACGIETVVLSHRDYASRDEYDRALAVCVERYEPDLVLLAGFMRILGADFVSRFKGRLMNIHPSLLPAFPGLNTHQRALDAGVKVHGATVHFVTPTVDHGPIIIQAAVPVLAGDDAEKLAARVLAAEHKIYTRAVAWFCAGRLTLAGDKVRLLPARARAGGELTGSVLVSP